MAQRPPPEPTASLDSVATRDDERLDALGTVAPANIASYRRILSYFGPDRLLLIGLVLLIWIALGAGVLEAAAVGALTDTVLRSHPKADWPSRLLVHVHWSRTASVLWLAFVWLALESINASTLLLREMINNQLRYNGTARARTELFDHLQTLSPAYHRSRPQGDAIYRISTDATGFFGVLDTFVGAANSILTVIVIGLVMASFNRAITSVCLCLTPILIVANFWFSRTIRTTSAVSKHVDTVFTTFVQRAFATITLAQLFGREQTESQRFRAIVDRTILAGMRMSWQQQLFPWVQRLIYAVGYAFVLGYGGYLVIQGSSSPTGDRLTVGAVTAMLVYLGQLWEPVRRMAGFTADVQSNVAACARVFRVLDLAPTVADDPSALPLAVRPRTLELRHVYFGYEPAAPVLLGIQATIEPGQMVAFVGPSGAGKSTLLNLLPRFYDPTSGSITLDGVDLRTIRLADIRGHIALVPQDSPVIAGTIAENIGFGRSSASIDKVRAAARMAGADSFIEELPLGYQTQVSEAGQNLSGGQRQRLAIARALLSEAPILVLDEPTSGLDRHHEQLILKTLQRLRSKRTIILVSHNLHAVTECDRIHVLENGRIVEAGTHIELMNRRELYASLASGRYAASAREQTPWADGDGWIGEFTAPSGQ